MRIALKTQVWDVILCDYSMPEFNALSALAVLKEFDWDIPFIIISGTVGEDVAVEAMRAGAHDYLMKDNLARLVPTVEREMQEAANRSALLRAESTAQVAEEKYQAIFDNAFIGIYQITPEGKLITANAALAKIKGYQSADKLLAAGKGASRQDYVDDNRFQQFKREIEEHGQLLDFESQAYCKDGSVIWISENARAVHDNNGRLLYYEGFVKDVTDRKRAEQAVKSAPTILVAGLGAAAVLTLLAVIEHYLEFGLGEVVALGLTTFVGALTATFITYFALRRQETLYQRTLEEIAERKRIEKALRQSEERYRLLFDSNPLPMWVYDLETLAFLTVNNAAVDHYGYSKADFLAMTIKDIRPPEDLPELLNNLSTLESSPGTGLWRHRKKDGEVISVEVTSHPLAFEGKDARLVLAQDVSERTVLEEQLRQSQKMEAIGRLAGGVAHDFNNLLTAIIGYSELTLARLEGQHPLRKNIEEIRKAGKRAASLTSQLLAFSRKQVMQLTVFDLNNVIAELGKMLRRLIGEDIELRTVLSPKLCQIKADAGQIEQIIMNLIVNARDAMPRGGKITIETNQVYLDETYAHQHAAVTPGNYAMLAVSDTGTGMDSATRGRIFEPFFTTKEAGKGTGLGLSMVYGIVKQSGGYVWVYSEIGQGTCFKIYLPISDEDVVSEQIHSAPRASTEGHETILLVEDEDMVRELALEILESHGYRVLEAATGEDAISIYESHGEQIDLLISDVIMPKMNGRELSSRLTRLRPELKVLFISGYTDDTVFHHGVLDEGAQFLQKPFSPDALVEKVTEVLNGS
jgi:hypothetical protein